LTNDPLEISPEEVAAALEDGTLPYALVDVREYFELSRGILPGSHVLPMSDIQFRISDLERERPIVCYCEHGIRSYDVAAWLQQQGFSARSMAGGFAEWRGPTKAWQPARE
jgi:rhodanese-related sulfurtransferase